MPADLNWVRGLTVGDAVYLRYTHKLAGRPAAEPAAVRYHKTTVERVTGRYATLAFLKLAVDRASGVVVDHTRSGPAPARYEARPGDAETLREYAAARKAVAHEEARRKQAEEDKKNEREARAIVAANWLIAYGAGGGDIAGLTSVFTEQLLNDAYDELVHHGKVQPK